MEALRGIDQIAYIRFASVYQSFEDLEDLKREVDTLYNEKGNGARCVSVLSDRDIRAALEAGTIKIEPYDPEDIQPSSVDLHLDRSFRVFRNNRYPYIDVRAPQPDLTETDDHRGRRAVHPPSRRIRPRPDARIRRAPERHRLATRG